jgi:hypothetical protein
MVKGLWAWPAARPALVLSGMALVLCHAGLGPGRVLLGRDIALGWHVGVEAMVRAVTGGAWPLWSAHVGFGQPLWADANNQVLYPFTLLHLVLRPWTVLALYSVAHLAGTAWGMRALGLRLGLSAPAAGAAAGLWLCAGPLLSLVGMPNQLGGAAWLPWAVLCGLVAMREASARWAIGWGACVAAQVLAGSPETALMGLVAAAALCLGDRGAAPGGGLRAALPVVIAGATALGLSAGQWLPSLDAARESARAAMTSAERAYWSVHPASLLELVWPLRLGALPLSAGARRVLFEGREPFLASTYLGLAALPLAGGALASRRARWARPLGAVGLLSVLVALGRFLPVHGLLTWLVPPLQLLRFPSKALVLAALCAALLAGLGLEDLIQARRRRTVLETAWWLLAAAAAVAAGLALVPWDTGALDSPAGGSLLCARLSLAALLTGAAAALARRGADGMSGRAATLLASVLVADPLLAHLDLNRGAPRTLLTHRPEIVDALRRDGASRLHVYDYLVPGASQALLGREQAYRLARAAEGWSTAGAHALAYRMYLFPPTAALWDLGGGFDVDVPRLAPPALGAMTDAVRAGTGEAHLRLLQLGAVSHTVSLHRPDPRWAAPVATGSSLYAEPVLVARVAGSLPRAYCVGRARWVPREAHVLPALLDPSFDARHEVVLVGAPGPPPAAPFSGRCGVVARGANSVTVRAEMDGPGWLVVVETYDRSWTARAAGVPVALERANGAFRAARLPAGRHDVVFEYRPRAVSAGLAATGLTAVLAAAIALRAGRREGTA